MDPIYSRILLATDLGPQSLYIGHQALKFRKMCHAQLHVIHAIEPPLTNVAHFSERDQEIDKLQAATSKSLGALCAKLMIPTAEQMIRVGKPQDVILQACQQHHCDLIIVGSHGVGGYTHNLGSTAHNLLETSFCDILIVQVIHLQEHIEKQTPPLEFVWDLPHELLFQKPNPFRAAQVKGGSAQGFGDLIERGPRPTHHPASTPYQGGTRKRTSEEEDENEEKSD
jgi:universal stress protein A